jgi:hypothetical protein
MNFVRLLPVFVSSLLLAAHFFRGGLVSLASICVSLNAILLVRHPWAARAVQLGLIVGSLEWMRTLFVLAAHRQSMGQPWSRMAAILGSVALFTLASAWVFRSTALKARYGLDRSTVSQP